jgi:hypothetical protein
METHIKQSETVFVKRSQLKYSAYNPKRHSKEQINQIKKNIKNVAFLGGIVWNSLTGNLIDGHKRVMALDIIHGYNGNADTDYEIKVEKIQLDTKTEKEQNIFQTQSRSELELDLLRDLVPEIDYKSAGLTDEDMKLIGFDTMLKTDYENDLTKQFEGLNAPLVAEREIEKQEKKADIKAKKEKIAKEAEESAVNTQSFVMLSFESYEAKESFMKRFGFNSEDKVISGEMFDGMIERIE